MNRLRRVPVSLVLLLTSGIGFASEPGKTLRVYFVGNSVTDTVRYGSLAKLAASRQHSLVWGRQMIPGAPLQWLWEHPAEGFTEKPYKDGIHLNEAGSFLVGCTFFATLFGEDPAGLPTEPYGNIPPAVAKAIQQTVWDTVRQHPASGVR